MFRPPWRRAPRRVSAPRWAAHQGNATDLREAIAMDDVPDLAALRRERAASDAEYIEQLEQLTLGLSAMLAGAEAERDRLRDDLNQVRGEHRVTWGDWQTQRKRSDGYHTKMEQIAAERDRLQAVVAAEKERADRNAALIGVHDPTGADHLEEMVVSVERAEAAEAERDRLRDERDMFRDQALPEAARVMNGLSTALAGAEAERDRLRAVVDLVKEYRVQHGRFWLLEHNEDEAVAAAERESHAWSEVVSALDALNEDAEAADG